MGMPSVSSMPKIKSPPPGVGERRHVGEKLLPLAVGPAGKVTLVLDRALLGDLILDQRREMSPLISSSWTPGAITRVRLLAVVPSLFDSLGAGERLVDRATGDEPSECIAEHWRKRCSRRTSWTSVARTPLRASAAGFDRVCP